MRLHFSLGILKNVHVLPQRRNASPALDGHLVQECGLLHCRHIAVYKGTTTEMFLFGEPRQLFLVILDELVQRTGLVQIQTTLSTQIDESVTAPWGHKPVEVLGELHSRVVLRSDVVEFSLKNVVLLPFVSYVLIRLVGDVG